MNMVCQLFTKIKKPDFKFEKRHASFIFVSALKIAKLKKLKTHNKIPTIQQLYNLLHQQ